MALNLKYVIMKEWIVGGIQVCFGTLPGAQNCGLKLVREKEVDYHSDFWADHDSRCHGKPSSFIDDPFYADGFTWSCCKEAGGDKGCKSTKHKAAVNIVKGRG